MFDLPPSEELIKSPANWQTHAMLYYYAASTLADAVTKASRAMNHMHGKTIEDPEVQWAYKAIHGRLPCMTCMGLSIEMLLKGLCLARNEIVIDKDGKLKFKGAGNSGHNLRGIAVHLGFMLSEEEIVILDRLSHAIVWGKYPGTLRPEEYENPFVAGALRTQKAYHPHRNWNVAGFMQKCDLIYKKIWGEYPTRNS